MLYTRHQQHSVATLSFLIKNKLIFSFLKKTKQMQADSIPKVSLLPKDKTQGPECGGEFCKLGCICTSLMGLEKAPLHCRRPECMFGCNCSKRKIMMKASPGEAEPQIQSVYCKIRQFGAAPTVSPPTFPVLFLNMCALVGHLFSRTPALL